ncbi:MAG: hypothetical protein EA407_14775 [Rhodobacteraceae bacterium]|nr:MAG: hypothetical protein EA407_14775 [Paracoccaceae bacterium]
MFEDYSERLFSHFVAGRWRVPNATQAIPVCGPDGRALGQIVPANLPDVLRASAALRAADAIARARAAQVVEASAESLVAAHAHQTGQRIDPQRVTSIAEAMAGVHESGAPVLMGAPSGPLPSAELGAALGAGLCSGVIWCPPPELAVFATHFAEVLQEADLPPGAFALLHAETDQTQAACQTAGLKAQK